MRSAFGTAGLLRRAVSHAYAGPRVVCVKESVRHSDCTDGFISATLPGLYHPQKLRQARGFAGGGENESGGGQRFGGLRDGRPQPGAAEAAAGEGGMRASPDDGLDAAADVGPGGVSGVETYDAEGRLVTGGGPEEEGGAAMAGDGGEAVADQEETVEGLQSDFDSAAEDEEEEEEPVDEEYEREMRRATAEEEIYGQIRTAPKKRAQFLLQQMSHGRVAEELYSNPPAHFDPEEEKQWDTFMAGFKSLTVDVNRSRKGNRSMGIESFSAMVVAGNLEGVLGVGVGKAKEMGSAIIKATAQAMKTLFPVPRYRNATLLEPFTAKYGKVKIVAYPLSSGSGIRTNNMLKGVCMLAGLRDVGVKVIGSRNPRNAVKALVGGLESQRTIPEIVAELKKTYGENIIIRELAAGHKRKEADRIPGFAGRWYLAPGSRTGQQQKRP